MHNVLPYLSFVLAGCLLGPARSAVPEPRAAGDLFPVAKQSIALPAEGGEVTLERLVQELERASGARFVSGPDAREKLAHTACGLRGPLDLSAGEAWSTIEALLAHHGFVIVPVHTEGLRIFGLESATGPARESLRGRAFQVAPEQVEALAAHPALLVQTAIDLGAASAGMLSQSLRGLLSDPMTEQIVPLGNTNRVILLGRAPQVASWARTLRWASAHEQPSEPAQPR